MKKPNHTMRKIFLIALGLVTFATAASAQSEQKDVTKFLGIPVDGNLHEMIQKLKEKGFVSSPFVNVLTGEFNGEDVYLIIETDNNKVYCIDMEEENYRDERDIRIRFNNLCRQFMNDPLYVKTGDDSMLIPENEDISYEMTVNEKRYSAHFYQQVDLSEETADFLVQSWKDFIRPKFSEEQLENPTEEIKKEIIEQAIWWETGLQFMKHVWFEIKNLSNGEYCISMSYENGYNKPNEEDWSEEDLW